MFTYHLLYLIEAFECSRTVIDHMIENTYQKQSIDRRKKMRWCDRRFPLLGRVLLTKSVESSFLEPPISEIAH